MKGCKWVVLILLVSILMGQTVYAQEYEPAMEVMSVSEPLTENEKETVQQIFQTENYINPLYQDEIQFFDLLSEEDVDDKTAVTTGYGLNYCSSVQEAGIQMREQMKQRLSLIEIKYQTTDGDYSNLLNEVCDIALQHTGTPTEGDYLRWQYAGWEGEISGNFDGTTYMFDLTYVITYYTTTEQEQEMDEAVTEMLLSVNLSDAGDYDKIGTIYNYICNNVTYDYDNYSNDDYKLKYTAYAALINKTAICQGYAVLLYRLLGEAGIDCRVIIGTGNGESHAWNIVAIDGIYYNLDATWDSALSDYTYFLKSDTDFGNHVRSEEYSTDEFYNFYPMSSENFIVKSEVEDEIIDAGSFGSGLYWTFSEDGVLDISGDGAIPEYYNDQYCYGQKPWEEYLNLIQSIIIKDGVTSVGSASFMDCSNLTTVCLPDSVTSIGQKAFLNCSQLSTINIPETMRIIQEYAFCNCVSLTDLCLPDSIFELGEAAFSGCTSLEQVNIPSELAVINPWLFYNCKITNIVLPRGITLIGDCSFAGCGLLNNIVIPDTVEKIGYGAFESCYGFTSIVIPGSVKR